MDTGILSFVWYWSLYYSSFIMSTFFFSYTEFIYIYVRDKLIHVSVYRRDSDSFISYYTCLYETCYFLA